MEQLGPALPDERADDVAARLGQICNMTIYPRSITAARHALYFLGRRGMEKWLGILSQDGNPEFEGTAQAVQIDGTSLALQICPTNHTNALALRRTVPFTNPVTLGLHKSVGCGDRLGLATPGHVRAVRRHTMIPIFAQQSIREMERTQRTPDQVMDDAMWGVFQEGWRDGYGADADHLKTPDDIDRCVDAGFTFYTIDPGDHVDNAAHFDDLPTLQAKVQSLPWDVLDGSPEKLRTLYLDKSFDLGSFKLTFDEERLWRAAAKYSKAIAHTVTMYRHLTSRMAGQPFELEVSVDETETPTTIHEHFFIASELKRLRVEWVSLAPRYIGRFEKGVDYIGDLAEFEASFVQHVAIAHYFGPYKLSLHSGSDKFSIYPIFAEYAGDLVHLKTAGTSYLEALRAIARVDPALFRDILAFALERYDEDRATYHVSANPAKVPRPEQLTDDELDTVLD
ncbi:MAG: hypothetical protein J7M34_05975, partial [Anaerolineae bacterium]|nr:hypothetical protein [Anaerolineae bacterium]